MDVDYKFLDRVIEYESDSEDETYQSESESSSEEMSDFSEGL
jgi:hypothetical protein